MTRYDLMVLASPPDDDSGDCTHCEDCSELLPRADLNALGVCEGCAWSWRDDPIENLSIIHLEILADEGNEEAAEIVAKWRAERHAWDRPLAHNDQLGWFDGDHT